MIQDNTPVIIGVGQITDALGSSEYRALSNLEAVAGQMYVAVVISRLVALQITHSITGRAHAKD